MKSMFIRFQITRMLLLERFKITLLRLHPVDKRANLTEHCLNLLPSQSHPLEVEQPPVYRDSYSEFHFYCFSKVDIIMQKKNALTFEAYRAIKYLSALLCIFPLC